MSQDKKPKLAREKQCKSCPWRVDAELSDIPWYDKKMHLELTSTIWNFTRDGVKSPELRAMACHCSPEESPEMCVGWLLNQVGVGNNLALRLHLRKYDLSGVEVFGEQYETLSETIIRSRKDKN
jgi:hypothetical protein